ncbi:MAG: ArsA family ATPase, partial [Longimicrobiales bacterium]
VVAGPEAAVQTAVRPSPGPAAPSPAPAARSAAAWMRGQSWQLVWFAGKGGAGKSTCAAAAALGLSDTRPVALHSTDPAGSLGEVFGRPIGAEPLALTVRLRVQQVDATAAFDVWRTEYRAEVAAVFEQLGITESVALDRRVLESALDLAPLGIDEIVALDHIIDAMEGGEMLIIDTAPTGHFLRLLEMPRLALDWAHALLRILLHHGGAGSLADVSQRVLAFAKRLKVLRSTLADPGRAAVFVVTLDEPMVRAETERLRAALRAAAIPEAAVIMNRATAASSCAAARIVRAPDCAVPPQGAAALRTFFDAWELA